MVIECAADDCGRLLYVEVKPGEVCVYCYKCMNVTLVEFNGGEVDEEG